MSLANDDIVDGLIAHLLNLKRTIVTIDIIRDYETQVFYF